MMNRIQLQMCYNLSGKDEVKFVELVHVECQRRFEKRLYGGRKWYDEAK